MRPGRETRYRMKSIAPIRARVLGRATRPLWSLSRKLHVMERDFARGVIMPALLETSAPSQAALAVPVVSLVSHGSWLMAAWMARSLDYYSRRNWSHLWLDDGTLTDEDVDRATSVLGSLTVIRKEEVDARLGPVLSDRPFMTMAAGDHPIFRRAFMLSVLLEEHDRLISIDSDVLFFARPVEILEWAESSQPEIRYLHDPITHYFPDPAALSEWAGFPVTPHINGGLTLPVRGAFDPDLTESLLRDFFLKPDRGWHIEQSILAVNFSRRPHRPLSSEHEISFHAERHHYCVARHYVGDGRTRDYFYTEGIRGLAGLLMK